MSEILTKVRISEHPKVQTKKHKNFLINRNIWRQKRSQQEIVGFVLIIVIVSVIALVFLGINLRKNPVERESLELSNFLSSCLKYTTDCTEYAGKYEDLREVIKMCYKNEKCSDGRDACIVLEESFRGILEESYPAGKNQTNKGVNLTIYYKDGGRVESIKELSFGEQCKGGSRGTLEAIYVSPGKIYADIHKC